MLCARKMEQKRKGAPAIEQNVRIREKSSFSITSLRGYIYYQPDVNQPVLLIFFSAPATNFSFHFSQFQCRWKGWVKAVGRYQWFAYFMNDFLFSFTWNMTSLQLTLRLSGRCVYIRGTYNGLRCSGHGISSSSTVSYFVISHTHSLTDLKKSFIYRSADIDKSKPGCDEKCESAPMYLTVLIEEVMKRLKKSATNCGVYQLSRGISVNPAHRKSFFLFFPAWRR